MCGPSGASVDGGVYRLVSARAGTLVKFSRPGQGSSGDLPVVLPDGEWVKLLLSGCRATRSVVASQRSEGSAVRGGVRPPGAGERRLVGDGLRWRC